ncbi:spore coat protein CotJB [Acetivibrio mesophilus]|uniref:Spore coat protein CotJB n=1 Tax=Acetivibrio mesophilus TaxID=2487273 RepID=A0A4Q0I7G5_9FIRM|nr:spore coat protein CotJB [Acetivibrio mesophilus]ODM25726.1 spore coat protein [Clostridium sp. Bc-iso-3]RXE60310.1 spore coat protein CotJB [Acetivibrio mesophilus]HHV30435.1 spore coat protein CotJB [Clostridium sp.]
MNPNQAKLLKEVMAADFTLIDLNLYLNTHPYDQNTIILFNNCAQRARMLRNEYERLYGPLTAQNSTTKCPWQWINSPWPWE